MSSGRELFGNIRGEGLFSLIRQFNIFHAMTHAILSLTVQLVGIGVERRDVMQEIHNGKFLMFQGHRFNIHRSRLH